MARFRSLAGIPGAEGLDEGSGMPEEESVGGSWEGDWLATLSLEISRDT